ncbi:type I polyketide synthase [Streptomyces sp. NPDC058525]|uniref:type I polyketide synthase n=1 Tax=Streptomyces sp. NPDC058525 TaxID=3346538 RepID=UPI003651FDD6
MRTDLIKPLPVAVVENATRFPGKVAFEDARRAVTYGDLEARTRRLAGHLAVLGVQRGDRVAICLGNTVSTVESYLAIVRAAGIGVPLNPASALAELEYLLADSGATVVITDAVQARRLRSSAAVAPGITLLVTGEVPEGPGVHSYDELAVSEPAEAARDDLGLDDVAWMFYTSGTTGRPKGVLSTQRNCLWSVASCYVPIPGLTDQDRVLWPLPLFHSLSHIACVLSVTVVGATARIMDGSSAEDVIRALAEDGSTFLAGVPTTYHHLVTAARQNGFSAPTLRIGLVGGAVTGSRLRQDFEEVFGVPLVDAYGSTETCGAITINPPDGDRVDGSCGLPVPGVGVRIVHPTTGTDVPVGQEGEVWVSGPNVMVGYHNSPQATAAAMQDGWYRTGDLARRDDAGYFAIRGRIKELVIRGGENIHPEEIEAVLRTVEGVADAAVAGVPHDTLGEVPVAYVIPGPAGFDTAALIDRCREQLAAYKVPEEVREVAGIPRTASGKIKRRMLAEQPSRLRYAASGHHDGLMGLGWVPAAAPAAPVSPAGEWAVAGPGAAGLVTAGLLAALNAAGVTGVRQYPDLAAVRAAVAGGQAAPEVTVLVQPSAAADATDPVAAGRAGARTLADQVRDWPARTWQAATRLVVLTRGAVAAGAQDAAQDLAGASLRALARSLPEDRRAALTLIDLEAAGAHADADLAPELLLAAVASGEPQIAVRSGALLVPRLHRLPVDDLPQAEPWPGAAGTVVVTGADTAHGAAIAHRLAAVHHAENLLLVSSPGSTGTAASGTEPIPVAEGTTVVRVTADGEDPEPLRAALAALPNPVSAVVHAAGDPELALLLDEMTAGHEPAAFVVVSNAAGLLGTGTSDAPDEAVDAILADALVRDRRLRNLPGSFLAWGAWPGGHDTADEETRRLRDLLLTAFDLVITTNRPSLLALKVPTPATGTTPVPAILAALAEDQAGPAGPDLAVTAALRERLSGLDERAQLALLEDMVRTEAAAVLQRAGGERIPSDRAFRDMGFTSMAVVRLRNRLSQSTGLSLATTVVFDHPTPSALSACLRAEVLGLTERVTEPVMAADPDEPLAIVGMACRLPGGVAGPEDLWRLVSEGRDALSSFPDDRGWDLDGLFDPDPERKGTSYTDQGGFLHDAGLFDAGFFGIAPREALAMDPQQRLLLETSWEALEAAGINPVSLKGSDVGVFSGLFGQGYGTGAAAAAPELEGFTTTGLAPSVASGRVSYVLGLEGPAVTVDTACSSSLVAMHLAAQALRQGECSMALAGGVAVMATPGHFVEFSRQRALAADGRCKAFSSAADGTGWAEGVGVVVLERLSVARERGHRVLAVLRGSAVNQDGASNGLTAPSGPSQQRVIRRALAGAGLVSADVDVVEAHGTGTSLGDPIEAQAILATYGQDRDAERPLWLGSLKSNIGHTQAAAGVAGVIKMVQALRHGVLPATLHVDEPTSQVDWSAGAVELLTEAREWPRYGRPRRAGVSSFGVSGTNAHLILEEAPAEETQEPSTATGAVPLVVSAGSAGSLAGQAARLASYLESAADEVPLASVAGALVSSRAVFGERAVVVADSAEEALTRLGALARGESAPGVVSGSAAGSGAPGRVVWVFPGQGSQWAGMGRELLDASPVFAERIAECATALAPFVDWSLIDVLRGETEPELMERVDVLQPASFAVMVGLAAVWSSVGVKPDAVLGHSQGEIAAACVAGALSLEDAARVVALRSQAIAKDLAGRGGMASVALSEAEAVARIEPWADRVEVAAVNGPSSVVIAGDAEALDEALEALSADGVRVRRVAVDYASHTRHVEDIREALAETLAGINAQAPQVPFYSTVTGTWVEDSNVLDGDYWYRNLRGQVGFGPAVAYLAEQGHGVFVEVSAHPVLVQPITETVHDAGNTDAVITGSLRREDGGPRRLLTSMAELFVRGVAVDWSGVLADGAASARVELPTYAFDHRHYWLEAGESATDAASLGLAAAGHPMLGAVVSTPNSTGLMATSSWSLRAHPWLADHLLSDVIVVPNAALVELAIRLGDLAAAPVLDELTVDAPVVMPQRGSRGIRVIVGESDDARRRSVEIYSRAADAPLDAPWTRHAHGVLAPAAATTATTPVSGTVTEIALDGAALRDAGRYGVHPVLLDAAVRTVVPAGMLPSVWTGVSLLASGAAALNVRAGGSSAEGTGLELTDPTGQPVMTVGAVLGTPFSAEQAGIAGALTHDALFRVDWTESVLPVVERALDIVTVATAEDVAAAAARSAAHAPDVLLYEATAVGAPAGADPRTAVNAALAVLQAWLAEPALAETRLAVVTGDGAELDAAAVWGLVRSAQSEHPDRIVLADLDEASRPALPAVVLSGEPQTRVRGGIAEVPRLARVSVPSAGPLPEAGRQPRPLDTEGTVLITGGTGTLGAMTARHLVTRYGIRHLVLAGRRGHAPELQEELTALGASVTIAACDISDRSRLEALLREIPAEHPLTAVVHSAGVLDDGVLTELTPERVDTVLRPKVDAALHLHELTRDLDLAAFVLYSSAAGVLGNPGQGNYAAANACLDALARQRHGLGLPAVSLAWGYWATVSAMTEHLSAADLRRNARIGMSGLSATEGMALLDAALGGGEAGTDGTLVAARFDVTALRASAAADGPVPALLRALAPSPRPAARAAAPSGPVSLRERLAGLGTAERTGTLVELVLRHAAEVLGHPTADAVHADRTFKEAGFDSLMAVELRNRLAAATGLTLSPVMIFDYPKPTTLADHLHTKLFGAAPERPSEPAAAAVTDDEPIAIVAMACRFPAGVNSPEDLWRVVADGIDAVTEFPDDRGWDIDRLFNADPDHAGTTYVRHGAFLDDAAGFDAAFFGISPNEALAMDPQQRLLLETSWEAFERAAIDPTTLAGEDVGVFVGVNSHDYSMRMHQASGVEGFRLTGGSGSVTSGRIAYHLGFEGPALTVDTACSSSLVALHLAAQALNRGECSMALAGGVMVMGTVETFVEFSRQRGLAPDGRCKAFADGADGTGWSEGAGLLLVERLSDARRRGHQVLAVVRGSAVNQDGASNGLTAPNGPAQQRVIRKALAGAGLSPSDVDAVEAHGTGTTLGDPIEAEALLATYGQERQGGEPLWLGSVKSNLGHTQGAAGVAGVIKMVMAMRHGVLPKTLHVDRPSTHVDWSAGAVELLTEARDWPRGGRPRRAGVSSFGIGGTNAHVVLEEAPEQPATAARELTPEPAQGSAAEPAGVLVPVPVSARTPAGLRGQAERLARFLDERSDLRLADAAHALATTRARLDQRAVVLASDRGQLAADLGAFGRGDASPAVVSGTPATGKLAVLFTGQGSQWAGMGRELAETFPVFRDAFAAACAAVEEHLRDHAARPLHEVVFAAPGSPDSALLDRTMYTQGALFALETALFRLFESWGVRPDLLAGHSIGEVAAAHVSGVLELAEAGKLVAARGRLMQALPEGGAMVAVQATEAEVAPLLARASGAVCVAAVNGPDALVLSGAEDAVLALAAELAGRGRKTRRLQVSHAFHSQLMEPMLDEFRTVARSLTYRPGALPVVSTLTGELVRDGQLGDPEYWVDQVRNAVRFSDAVTALSGQGATTFLEIGPGGALAAMALGTLGAPEQSCIATLRKNGAEAADVMTALAHLHVRGTDLDWPALLGTPATAAGTDLPTYAFQHQRYWVENDETPAGGAEALGATGARHPLLGTVIDMPGDEGDHGVVLTGQLSARGRSRFAGRMAADGTTRVPAAALLEMIVRAADEVGCGSLEQITVEAPLTLPEHGSAQIRVSVDGPGTDGRRRAAVHARPLDPEQAPWTCHARAELVPGMPQPAFDLRTWSVPADSDALLPGAPRVWQRDGQIFAEIALAEEPADGAARFALHPGLVDTALRVLDSRTAADRTAAGAGHRDLTAGAGLAVYAEGAASLRLRITPAEDGRHLLELADAAGEPVAILGPLALESVTADGAEEPAAAPGQDTATAAAEPRQTASAALTRRVVARGEGAGDALAGRLAGLPAAEQHRVLLDVVRECTALVLGHRDADGFDADQSFKSLGFDSLTAVKFCNRMRDLTGLNLPATLVFDYPNPAVLTDHLRAELLGEQAEPSAPAAASSVSDEPIAIVAMSSRLPGGADSPEELWKLVVEQRDAVSGFPLDRDWDLEGLYHPDPAHPGTSYTRSGGFLHEAAQFDAGLFGISPREALAMDPQQRLLLETSWEALERAGIDPLSVRGRDIGVFTGIVHHDYVTRLHQVPEDVQGYLMTGTAASVASGRVSYVFGFEGPAVTVDTACSSSLVAMHLAAQSLRQGECSMALAGGATVMASPDAFMEFSRQRGLSADGRCKAFSSAADGTGWAEGVGVVVLERLSVARERGHRVLAVLRGSAVNQDGASNGLTAPNGPSQQRVIRKALDTAGLTPADVDLVEAHGTGTALGDPIEAQALLATYGQGRDPQQPLWLGSLKSNIGHTQAAAGVAGVIKMVMAMQHGLMPATLHVEEPTGQVDWSAGAVELLTEARDWPETGRPRRAAVSSFGASGTNAHLILEQAPAEEAQTASEEHAPTGAVPLVVSARSAGSLAGQAGRLAAFVEGVEGAEEAPLAAVAGALVSGRAVLGERAVVVAGSDEEALAGLKALARGESAPGVVSGSAGSGKPGKVVWVFPGQGSQWAGMGRELLDSSPVFAERIAACAEALAPFVDWSLIDVLRGETEPELIERVDVLQPASFAVMVGLAAVWRSVGVEPGAVLGHSQGEIAAACVAGALSLDDAARVVALRSQVIAKDLAGRGGMASVALSADAAVARLEPWADRVEVAAVNGPSSVVVAGDAQALDEALAALSAEGVRVRRVAVDYASHTRHVEDVRETLAEALAGIDAQAPKVPFYSTTTGTWVEDAGVLDGGYWYRNLRGQVGFGPAVADLMGQGHGVFVEVSAHPVLVQPITETADTTDTDAVITGSLRREDGGLRRLLASMAELFVRGVAVDWTGVLPLAAASRRVELPTYAFDRQRYWLQEAEAAAGAADAAEGADSDFWAAVEQADLDSLGELLEMASTDERSALGTVVPVLAEWRGRRRERSTAEKLRYHVTWQPLEREAAGVPGGRWLVVVPAERAQGGATDALLAELTGLGLGTVLLEVGESDRTRKRLAERLAEVLAGQDLTGVLSLLAVDQQTGGGRQDPTAVTASTLALIQALGDNLVTQPLWCLTRGAVNIGIHDTLTSPVQASLWGLGRAAALERLDRWGGLVDLPAVTDPRTAQYLLGVLNSAAGEDQLAVRRSGVYTRRLVRKPVPESTGDSGWQPRGTVLVTGGAEGLGKHVSVWLAQAGVERLLVTTTAQATELSVPELRAELAGLGVATTVESCADSDREAIARLVDATAAGQPVTAVVHAADVQQTSSIDDTAVDDLAGVFAAKVDTAVWLDGLFESTPLDAFVVFSSIAGVWGGGGQGPSGAANAVLDALIEWRRARGLRATSIAWGALDQIGVGMDEAALAQLRRRGVLPMGPQLAVTAMVQAVRGNEKFVAVADMDWGAFIPAFTSVRTSPLFADLPEARQALQALQGDGESSEAASSLADSLRGVAETEQNRILLRLVRGHASTVLGHSGAEGIGPRQAFQEVGFDSLAAVNLRNSLNGATGLKLPATLIFDYPTPEALVGYLRDELLREADDGLDGREDELRQILASVPFARFKEAGVLDTLLGLAEADADADADAPEAEPSAAAADVELIDAMDVADLVQRALGKTS